MVAADDDDLWHAQWLPQWQGSGAFRQTASQCAADLDLELPKAPCDSTFLYLFERVELEERLSLLREWMLAQIAVQDKVLVRLVYEGKHQQCSAAQPDGADGATRFVTQVTLYERELGVAIAQTSFNTGESHERAALTALLSTLELDGVLIQADALHTSPALSASS